MMIDLSTASPGERPPQRCADAARSAGLDPVGSASGYDDFVLIEWPLRWPRDASDVEEFADVVQLFGELKPRRIRLQLVVGREPPRGEHRVIVHRRREAEFSGFSRHERRVAPDRVGDACRELLSLPSEPGLPATMEVTDLLLCAHGTRDVCCGARGTRLFQEVVDAVPQHVQVWRTSHTGGHRFAPTAITMPDGQYWGYLDASAVHRILTRDPDVRSLRAHHRGSAGCADAAAQAVDRELLVDGGWEWLRWQREVIEVGSRDASHRHFRVDAFTGEHRVRYAVEVVMRPTIELTRCGESDGVGTADEQVRVIDLVELPVRD